MSIIDDMVHLVMQDPNVTAKEIAAHLGYAEEKSVYYWLHKAGFQGLRDFRLAVLRRRFPPPPEIQSPSKARDSGSVSIPLYPDGDRKARPTGIWQYIHSHAGPSSFGIIFERSDYPPVVSRGDVLVVDPDAPCFQGDLVWVSVKGAKRLARHYGSDCDKGVFVDAAKPGTVFTPDAVEGKVVLILKSS
ncbi:MAG: hypothetical protein ACOX5M_04115 [Bacillota bacterium]